MCLRGHPHFHTDSDPRTHRTGLGTSDEGSGLVRRPRETYYVLLPVRTPGETRQVHSGRHREGRRTGGGWTQSSVAQEPSRRSEGTHKRRVALDTSRGQQKRPTSKRGYEGTRTRVVGTIRDRGGGNPVSDLYRSRRMSVK